MANYSFILPVNENTPISSFYGNRKNPFDKSSNIKNIKSALHMKNLTEQFIV